MKSERTYIEFPKAYKRKQRMGRNQKGRIETFSLESGSAERREQGYGLEVDEKNVRGKI